jgi:hypothetical protein
MPRASPAVTNFNAGELSPLLDARVDLDFYGNGCADLKNFIPTVQGPAVYRPGTVYVDAALSSAQQSWLKRFEFNYEQAYVLEFNNDRLGFFSNRGRVQVNATVTNVVNDFGLCRYTTAAPHGLTTGQTVTIAGVVGIPLANGTYGVVVVSPTEFGTLAAFSGAYISGGAVTAGYSIATPYTTASLVNPDGSCALSSVQIGDVVYLAGGGQPPQTLSRTAPTSWTLAEFRPDDGPYEDLNDDESLTVYASAATGTVTLTASAALFTANHVGALFRIEPIEADVQQWTPTSPTFSVGSFCRYGANYYEAVNPSYGSNNGTVPPTHTAGEELDGTTNAGRTWRYLHSGYGVVRITGFTSATVVTATVLSRLPADVVGSGKATWRWRMGAWGAHAEYPTRVTLWRDRLVFSGLRRVWMSQSNDFDSFAPDEFGETTALSGVVVEPASTDNNAIRWIAPADALLVGTASTEFAVSEITDSDPFGPANVKAVPQSREGGRAVPPVQVGDSTFFVHRSGGLRETAIRDTGKYGASDLSVRAEHLADNIVDMAYQSEPDSVVWVVSGDALTGLTYDPGQQVIGWHQHPGLTVESVAVIPSPDGTRDDVWLSVLRGTSRAIERIGVGHEAGADPYEAIYLDAAVSYDGTQNVTLNSSPVSAAVGTTATFTAGSSKFAVGDVGRFIHARYQSGSTWVSCKAQITAYLSATQVQATILAAFPSAIPTTWRLSVTQVSGVPPVLQGRTVGLLLDGSAYEATGAEPLVLPVPASRVHVGIPYTGQLRPMRLEAGSAEGVAQGKVKRISKVVVRMQDTAGIRLGSTFTNLDEVVLRKPSDLMDEPVPLYTGDKLMEFRGGFDTDGYICVEQSKPLPATIVGLFPQVNTSDR